MMSKYHHPLKNKNTDETIYIAIAIVISYGLFFCFQILYAIFFFIDYLSCILKNFEKTSKQLFFGVSKLLIVIYIKWFSIFSSAFWNTLLGAYLNRKMIYDKNAIYIQHWEFIITKVLLICIYIYWSLDQWN